MADFLLELLSEEIPARMQAKARADLERLFVENLSGAGLVAAAIETYATPRRLILIARGRGAVLPQPGAFTAEDQQLLAAADGMLDASRAAMTVQAVHQALQAIWTVCPPAIPGPAVPPALR